MSMIHYLLLASKRQIDRRGVTVLATSFTSVESHSGARCDPG